MAALYVDTEMVNRVQYSLSRTAQNKSFPHDTKSKMYQIYIPLHFIKCGWNQEQPSQVKVGWEKKEFVSGLPFSE